ncbi:MAG: hypothetical protein ACJ76V_09445, partial [Thermoleophilaceae bacterium]
KEMQTHGYEVDLVAARADRLVLATVKSFFGSRGVVADHVTGETTSERGRKLYGARSPFERERLLRLISAALRAGPRSARLVDWQRDRGSQGDAP